MNFEDLAPKVLRDLKDENSAFWSVDEINEYLNESQSRYCEETGYLRRVTPITNKENREVYTFPDDMIRLLRVENSESNEISLTDSQRLQREYGNFRTSTGTAQYLYSDLDGKHQFRLHPRPSPSIEDGGNPITETILNQLDISSENGVIGIAVLDDILYVSDETNITLYDDSFQVIKRFPHGLTIASKDTIAIDVINPTNVTPTTSLGYAIIILVHQDKLKTIDPMTGIVTSVGTLSTALSSDNLIGTSKNTGKNVYYHDSASVKFVDLLSSFSETTLITAFVTDFTFLKSSPFTLLISTKAGIYEVKSPDTNFPIATLTNSTTTITGIEEVNGTIYVNNDGVLSTYTLTTGTISATTITTLSPNSKLKSWKELLWAELSPSFLLTSQSASEASGWLSLAWSPQLRLFVAIASSGSNRVMTSPDGITWSSESASETISWRAVVWASELSLFVAVASSAVSTGRVMTSPDGATWSTRIASQANQWFSLAWSPELTLFAAVSLDGTNRVMTSVDGITWSNRVAAEANPWTSVIWSRELALFIAVSTSGTTRVMTSVDGITWVGRTAAEANQWNSVTWSAGLSLLVAVASTGTNRVMTSPDGTTWTARVASENNSWTDIEWSEELGMFLATSDAVKVMTSADGKNWRSRDSAETNQWTGIEWAAELGIFAIIANSGTNRVMISSGDLNDNLIKIEDDAITATYSDSPTPEIEMNGAVGYQGNLVKRDKYNDSNYGLFTTDNDLGAMVYADGDTFDQDEGIVIDSIDADNTVTIENEQGAIVSGFETTSQGRLFYTRKPVEDMLEISDWQALVEFAKYRALEKTGDREGIPKGSYFLGKFIDRVRKAKDFAGRGSNNNPRGVTAHFY